MCKCGLRVDLGADHFSLDYVQERIRDCYDVHATVCPDPPEFVQLHSGAIDTLTVRCPSCNFYDIIV